MKPCMFTVSFAGFWGQAQLTLEQSVDKIADLGFQGIEIMGKRPHLSPLDYSLDDCKRLREQLDRRRLKPAAIAGYTNFTGGMDSAEAPFIDMQIAYVEALSGRAEVLGGDLVRIFTSYERDDVPLGRQWRQTVAAIRECCDRAAEYGVTIGVQNHHDIGVDTKTFAELLYEVDRPNVIPMYDCWSLHLRGEDIAAGVAKLGPAMRFTTVADYVALPRARYCPELVNYRDVQPPLVIAVPMGKGDLDYPTFFDGLDEAGFDGWVSYEMCSPLRDGGQLDTLETYAKAFLEYMTPRTT